MELKDWIDAGYKRWETSRRDVYKLADFGLQKLIRDQRGKKYYITVYVYDRTRYPGYPWQETSPRPYGFMPTSQFHLAGGGFINVERNGEFTVHQIEEEFDGLWSHFGKPYYRLKA